MDGAIGQLRVVSSPLSEFSVMGLEYGCRRRVVLPGKAGTELANTKLFFQLSHMISILPLKIAQQALAAADHID